MNHFKFKEELFMCGDKHSIKTITFPYPIREAFEFKDCYIVRIEPSVKDVFNENVFGVSKQGEILWQIEPIPYVYEKSPYTGMANEGDIVKLCNWDGTDLWIDPLTGKILKKGFSK